MVEYPAAMAQISKQERERVRAHSGDGGGTYACRASQSLRRVTRGARYLVSSVIRTITITALFHPARHWRRRHARRLGSDSLGRSRRRNRGRDFGARRIARRILENAIEIADLHRVLLHHGRQGSGELIDFPRSDTT